MEERREHVGSYCRDHPELTAAAVFRHFRSLKYKRTFVFEVVKKVKNQQSIKSKPKTGRKQIKLSPNETCRLQYLLKTKSGLSYRYLGLKFGFDKNTMQRIIGSLGYNRRAQKTAPKVTDKQIETQKTRLQKARRASLRPKSGLEIIMDKSHFGFSVHKNGHYFEKD